MTLTIEESVGSSDVLRPSDLMDLVDRKVASSGRNCALTWTSAGYQLIPKIDSLLGQAGLDGFEIIRRTLSPAFWASRNESGAIHSKKNGKIEVVFHIRLGDCVWLPLDDRTIFVNGLSVSTNTQELERIWTVDPTRKFIPLERYEHLWQRLVTVIGRENFSGRVISDGFDRTFRTILRALIRGELSVSPREARTIRRSQATLRSRLQSFLRQADSCVVGESSDNLLKSIEALASADIVVWGTGGFAFYLHQLFRREGQESVFIHANEDVLPEALDLLIKRKKTVLLRDVSRPPETSEINPTHA